MTHNDIRGTPFYHEAEALYRAVRQPGTGAISDAAEVSTNGHEVVFSGTLVDVLLGTPPTRICLTDLETGNTRVLTFGPNTDRSPKFSPDGRLIAFASDRSNAGNFQLYLLDPITGISRATPTVDGWVEYLHWSPDGRQILLGVAGYGADVAGVQGGVASETIREAPAPPSWMPIVQSADETFRWRHLWVYEVTSDRVRRVTNSHRNVWEAVWCGDNAVAAVVSFGPTEGLWYGARLALCDMHTGDLREVYAPEDQIGWPAASPSGRHLAIVDALCSDRWFVAGDLRVIDTISGIVQRVNTKDIDVTYTEWRSDRVLLLGGHRGFETVVGLYDTTTGTFTEVWADRDLTAGGFYFTAAGLNELGDCVLVGESFLRAPEIALIRQGRYKTVKSFDLGYNQQAKAIQAVECVTWTGADGLEVQGWLLLPFGEAPHPLIMNLHGGPVWQWRPVWLGRRLGAILMLLKHGYAVFLPNPRGSTGRGRAYVSHVLGEMGGADGYDCLSGLDYLVERGLADPKRLGVTGISYGGFMAAWLITQDIRFAAAVPVAPVTNQVTEHLVSNIPQFVSLFLADKYTNLDGKYYERSPIMHAHKVTTPTLVICGALDRCTPPSEAVQFHNALLENGAHSVLVTYPEEGHGIRKFPAAIDYAARLVAWFVEYIGTGRVLGGQ